MDKHDLITAADVRAMFDYNRDTGVFVWRRRSDVPDTWNSRFAGCVAGWEDGKGYTILTINYVDYRAHRVAWLYETGEWPSSFLDHRNGNVHDNRLCNLRLADKSQNAINSKTRNDNTSGVKGVSWDASRDMWAAYIKVDRKKVHLGRFLKLEDAKRARQEAARIQYGAFLRETL